MASAKLLALITAADAAPDASRIEYRDRIAAYGPEAIPPLMAWIGDDRHAHFCVAVLEAIARDHRGPAVSALREAERRNAGVTAFAREARTRLGPRDTSSPQKPSRSSGAGVLDQAYRAEAPAGQLCEYLTLRGLRCGNPANYFVDERWSCSRDHRR